MAAMERFWHMQQGRMVNAMMWTGDSWACKCLCRRSSRCQTGTASSSNTNRRTSNLWLLYNHALPHLTLCTEADSSCRDQGTTVCDRLA